MIRLVRHGETSFNVANLISGRGDVDLTERGVRQARALAAALPPSTVVISSPLRRARRTAEALGRPVEVDDRWIEIDYGSFEGRPVSEARDWLWGHWADDPEWAPPGGESLAAVQRRVVEACGDLRARFGPDQDVTVVTHVSPIKAAVAWALDVSPAISFRLFVEVASVTSIAVDRAGTPFLHAYNDTTAS